MLGSCVRGLPGQVNKLHQVDIIHLLTPNGDASSVLSGVIGGVSVRKCGFSPPLVPKLW